MESTGELYALRSRMMKENLREKPADIDPGVCQKADVSSAPWECRSLLVLSIVSERDNVFVPAFDCSPIASFLCGPVAKPFTTEATNKMDTSISDWSHANDKLSSLIAGLAK